MSLSKTGYRTFQIRTRRGEKIPIMAGPRVVSGLDDLRAELDLYDLVKLDDAFAAVYKQGRKDGARETAKKVKQAVVAACDAAAPQRPGRPKLRR